MMNFPLNLAVGFAQPVNQVGNYVYYKAGSAGGADPSIKVKTDQGDEYILMPGQGFRLDKKTFTNLQVTNAGGVATIIGLLMIADGGFFDNRVTGSVEVIDGGKARTLAGSAFIGTSNAAATAGNYGFVQLWNPPGSGKNIIVERITASSATAGAFGMFVANVAIANSSGVTPVSKKAAAGVPASVTQIRYEINAVGTVTGSSGFMDSRSNQANSSVEFKVVEPIIVTPGYGVHVGTGVTNQDIRAVFEWFEESNA
ncbi:hypothetical protein [Herbaspirillum rubrisubalbicans]|uniref:Uncharacterized protein n=1 Tax=Herbaspirillum rubrisubalbicans TaxID=80842 RepID=A0AAD0XH93_9BURK|nr:hypothetical protein [Herbaspirillum rubrisubalbicans]AYR24544.1 hypothetical protein RC54_12200 [Herbaspirillum rubrisubalbicans]